MFLPPSFNKKHKLKSVSKKENVDLKITITMNLTVLKQMNSKLNSNSYRLKQSRKGYIGNLTKCINCGINLFEIPHNTREVALMKEKLEFAVFKLARITDEYSQYVTLEEQAAAHHLYIEHKTRADIVITKCLEYVEQNESSTDSSSEALGDFFDNS